MSNRLDCWFRLSILIAELFLILLFSLNGDLASRTLVQIAIVFFAQAVGVLISFAVESKLTRSCFHFFDLCCFGVFVALCGGSTNPFGFLLLAYIPVAAVSFGAIEAALAALAAMLMYSLGFWYFKEVAVLSHHHQMHGSYSLHLQAMWLAFATTALTLTYFLIRLLSWYRSKEKELNAFKIKMERQAQLALVAQLAASSAHSLKTPLMTIELAAKELELQTNRSEDLEAIFAALKQCQDSLRQMQSRAALESEELPKQFSSSELIEDLSSQLTEDQRALLSVDSLGEVRIVAPKQSFQENIKNLILNAFESYPNFLGPVRLRIEQESKRLKVIVSDLGSGMDKSTLDNYASPFFTTKTLGVSLGLGTFSAKSFFERLGGSLEVSSEVGKGTTVTAWF